MPDARQFTRAALLISLLATAIGLYLTGLTVTSPKQGLGLPATVAIVLAMAHFHQPTGRAGIDRLMYGAECFCLCTLASLVGSVATYPLAAASVDWQDHLLLSADAFIGFDWLAYWNFIMERPQLHTLLDIAYDSFFLSPAVVIAGLAIVGKLDQAYRFLAAFVIALFITDISLPFIPGKSAAAFFLSMDDPYLPDSGMLHIPIIEQLRAGSLTTIDLSALNGLIAFPSFHTAAAILFAWAGWQIPLLRWPLVVINVAMILSVPIQGGHYFIDLVGGCAVAFAAIAVARSFSATTLGRTAPGGFLSPAPGGRNGGCETHS